MSWIACKDRLPEVTGVYPACSAWKERTPPKDWMDALYYFNAEVKTGEIKWQHPSGFYDNGITHWLEIPSRPENP